MNQPLAPVTDGHDRDNRGRFLPGNRAGRGNPLARRAQRLRAELYRAVTPDDLRAVVAALVAQAKLGDVPAARELLSRLIGPPADLLVQHEHQHEGPVDIRFVVVGGLDQPTPVVNAQVLGAMDVSMEETSKKRTD